MLGRTISSWSKLLGLGQTAEVEEDRRAFGRVPCDIETVCLPAGRNLSDLVQVRVKNVSRGGICLVAPRAFRAGELLSVSLPDPQEPVSELLACVVRCDSAGDGRWELGCTFAQSLTDDDLRRFGARHSGQTEQRNWVRFTCHARAAYQIVRTPEPTTWTPAEVLNISCGGIALQVQEALTVGDLLSVELSRTGVAGLTALASIVRTTVLGEGKRLIGCNFIHELPESQMAKLLG